MAKVIKKTAPKPAAVTPAPAPAPEKKTRNRKAVLVKVTASWLREHIGADTQIGVSRKELTKLLTKENDPLAALGL